ncbi:hypothetical protein GC163_11320 [bacterium]|nr:hypothetical protein [bacterium]
MIDFQYLQTGLVGLARAHLAGTMAGHLGAAVTAGYFFGEDQSALPDEVYRGIEGEIRRVIAGEEAIWWNARQAGVTPADLFEPFPMSPSQPEAIRSIAVALRENVGQLRQSGHNVIFAAIGLRALHDHPDLATQPVISGVRRLIAGFNTTHGGRGYYGKAAGWKTGNQVPLAADASFPEYQSLGEMVDVTLQELVATAALKRQGFGGLWHIINHAAAIAELDRLGYHDLATEALSAHHQHIQLWRTLPDVAEELGPMPKSAHDPCDPVYWAGMLKRDEARLTHRIKTLYGFYTLLRFVESPKIEQQAQDAFRYLMA